MTSGDGGRFSARERLRWMAGAAALATARDGAAASSDRYPRNLTQADIERWMTELSNWGRWGKEDQAGTVNLITPAKRRQAAALIKEGISVSMSLDADIPPKGSPEAEAPPPPPAAPNAGGRGSGRGNAPRYTWTHTMRSNGVRRQLFFPVSDNYFSRSTTTTRFTKPIGISTLRLTGAEDKALQGCTLSADSGARPEREAASAAAPPVLQ